nr:G-type lectin S-receptor-like serine/threonine-protein kinase At2g19130 [Tanacetum cinerariifolium]
MNHTINLSRSRVAALTYGLLMDGFSSCIDPHARWTQVAFIDFMIDVLPIWAWFFYKESRWIIRLLYIFTVFWFGSVVICGHILMLLFKLTPEESSKDPIYFVLVRRQKCFISNENESYLTYSLSNPSIMSIFEVGVYGELGQFTWLERKKDFDYPGNPLPKKERTKQMTWWPEEYCSVYAFCGAFGICRQTEWPLCNCLTGFKPRSESDYWSQDDFSGGCVRKTELQCGRHEENSNFIMVKVVNLPSNKFAAAGSAGECHTTCMNNCSCNAYSFANNECSLWDGELLDILEGNANGKTIYVKVASKDLPAYRKKHGFPVGPVTGSFLESINQGEKQFRSEVSTIGNIQHVNIVRLRGFCAEGNNKLLVYDYMPNGSLHSHLFSEKLDNVLNWKTRYQIALGTARGLAYLHDKCRNCIIHCDIKPENILLDADLHAQIADFGLAKLVGRDFSRVLTTMRGTRGYLAPEWLSGGAITAKADVFSYGMMLFELVHGKRNTEIYEDDSNFSFFPSLAASVLMAGGDIHSLIDSRLNRVASVDEVMKILKVAYWCIQDEEDNRPSMSLVEHILEGVSDVNMPPIPKYVNFFVDKTDDDLFFTKRSSNGSFQSNFSSGGDFLSDRATSGIGLETARVLALHGVHVVIGVRNVEAGNKVKEGIVEKIPNAKIDVMELDISSLESVRKFVSQYCAKGLPLNILM